MARVHNNYTGLWAGTDQGPLQSKRTRLVQRSIRYPHQAHQAFASNGANGDEVCLVCTPRVEPGLFFWFNRIPAGYTVLWERFGKRMGLLDPGAKWFWPAWSKVNAVVSRQQVTYNAIPKKCPTQDMVFVDVDLSINFKVYIYVYADDATE